VFRIGVAYAKQQPVQSAAKLHRFVRGKLQRVNIHAVEGKVNNEARPSPALGNATQRGEPQPAQAFDQAIR
jgi:hypothetical protein